MRGMTKEYIRFLRIALASAAELETQLILCQRLKLLETDKSEGVSERAVVIMKMLNALIKKLKNKL